MGTKTSSPGPLVWIAAIAAVAALAYFGWRSNQARPTTRPANAPGQAAPGAPQQAPPATSQPTPAGALDG
jgi:uncharacterized membrane protein YebE (DUF533 family)